MTSAEASGPNSVIRARRRVDHLETDHLGGLQVGASLKAGELRVADGGDDDAEKGLAHARNAAEQQVAGIDLPFLVLVVGRRNLRQQHDIGERLLGLVADQGLAGLGDDRVVQVDGFLELRMHSRVRKVNDYHMHDRRRRQALCGAVSGFESVLPTTRRSQPSTNQTTTRRTLMNRQSIAPADEFREGFERW